jgi:transposase-like protein
MDNQMRCPRCNSSRMCKAGFAWCGRNKRQRFVCLDCHTYTIKPINGETEAPPVDEETSAYKDA